MSYQETVLDVTGMSCSSCVRHVSAALSELDGVTKVEVRLGEGRVLVQHAPGAPSVDAMIEALREAGYESSAHA
jgi:copper chaperone